MPQPTVHVRVLHGSREATADDALNAAVAAALDGAGDSVSHHAGADDLLREAVPGASSLVVVGPSVDAPLAMGRRIAQRVPDARFVFVVAPDREAAFRQEAVYAAPPGGRWALAGREDPRLAERIAAELRILRQQRRLRTTLDRMKLARPPAALADASEYRRLVASDRYLASVLRHAHDAIVSLDAEGRVVSWNRGAELLFGLTAEQARRARFEALFTDPGAASAAIEAALGGSFRSSGLELDRAGDLRYVDANFGTLRDDDRAAIGVVAILRDITERHRAEEELRASSRQKDEFLAMLAHELRNPLAPIRSATQVLAMLEQADPRARRAIDVIGRQAEHMAALIDDLLDVARVTRGAIVLEREVLAVAEVLRDAAEQAATLVEARGHRLELHGSTDGVHVFGDRKRLTQVVANLLVNAARYTPPGGHIRLGVVTDARQVFITVTDNGIGMDASLRERVFELFVQGERSPDRAEGGLGVGLSLVRSLVALHGGSVAALSEGPGRGSRFEVRLPRARPVPAHAASPSTATPASTHLTATRRLDVMVVDDNADAAQTLGMLLQALGHRVDVEVDPRLALERATRRLPEVCILDIGMPHIDGYELARRIRALPARRVPVLVALTGYGHPSDRERAALAGFDHHLVKPLDTAALLGILGDVAAGQAR